MELGVYIHNKTGNEYLVRGNATDCTNKRDGTKCVIYHLYDDFPETNYFVREINEFKEKFTFYRKY